MKILAQSKPNGFHQPMLTHYCPACETTHSFAHQTPQKNGALWSFNGNFEFPTLTPSMHIRSGPWDADARINGHEYDVCHYHLTEGVIHYLPDCTHEYAGKLVNLPELPERYVTV